MIRVVVVDDEPPARQRLERMLQDHPDVVVAGSAGDVPAAAGLLARERPDLVFLDIQLPAADGFTLLELLGRTGRPAVICTTAHAGYAVRAFDEAAIDYLLKPFSRERLAEALARFRDRRPAPVQTALAQPIARPLGEPVASSPRTRIPVPGPAGTVFVEVRRIDLLRSERNYVRLVTADRGYLVRSTLAELERSLPADHFLRVSRSAIVRVDRIAELRSRPRGELEIHLSSGRQVPVGRSYTAGVRLVLGV